MKILLLLLVSFTTFVPLSGRSESIHRECMGEVCPADETINFAGFFTLPIVLNLDGSINFSWSTTQTTPGTAGVQGAQIPGPTINWYFSPVVAVEIDHDKVLVNLSQNTLNKSINLAGANKEAGYMVLQKSGFELGIGGGAFFEPISSLTFGFGLLPTGGSMIYSERFAPNLEAANKLPKMKFPKDAKSLDSWTDNDVLIYTRKGGVTFFGQGSAYGASAGLAYQAIGTWKVFLKKISAGKIVGTVSKMSLNSFGVYVGATVASLNLSVFGETDKSFAYEFDLASKSGQQGFDEFLTGNFKFTKRMAREGVIEGVTAITESNSHTTGRVFGVGVGIPFIASLDFGKGMIQSFSEIHNLKNNQKIENNMAVYSRTVETSGFASKQMKSVSLFSASHQEVKDRTGIKKGSFTTANFKWMFSQEKSKVKDIKSRVIELQRMTGLWNTLDFNFPEEKKLAYSKFEFDAMISSGGTEKLLANNLEGDTAAVVQDKIEDFFNQGTVSSHLCRVFKKIETCKSHLLKTSSHALKNMALKLDKMKELYQAKNWKSFTETYAELGKEAITNQFTFAAFREMIGKKNLKMEFKVSGEKLAPLRLDHFENDLAFQ